MQLLTRDLTVLNKKFAKANPKVIINNVLQYALCPVVTTNFGPYSAALLNALVKERKNIPVLWVDTGYNMTSTYRFAHQIESQLGLNMHIYAPQRTRAFLDHHFGDYMASEEGHQEFIETVKIEPIKRAFDELQPDIWFTNIRKSQTSFRASQGIFSKSPSGRLKVSPFYHYTDKQLQAYLDKHNLPNELTYFDPTKIFKDQECGLHLAVF